MAYGDWAGQAVVDPMVAAQRQLAGGATGGITGTLPWGAGGTPNLNDPAQAYQQAYSQALAMNKAMYSNIEQGFTAAGKQLRRGQRRSMSQVNKLGRAERTDIADAYNAQVGDAAQTLINRGLGNTTVQQSVNRGIEADRSKANIRLTGELAKMRSDLQDRFNTQRLALNTQKLGFMNSMTAAYPDFGAYASLLQSQQAGAAGGGLMGGGFGGASISSGSNPFSSAARAERMNWVSNPAMGSAMTGNYGAPINYGALPSRGSVYGAGKTGAVQQWSGYEDVTPPMGIEAWDYYGEN